MSQHKTGYVISYHGILSQYVICHDYRGIPSSYTAGSTVYTCTVILMITKCMTT